MSLHALVSWALEKVTNVGLVFASQGVVVLTVYLCLRGTVSFAEHM